MRRKIILTFSIVFFTLLFHLYNAVSNFQFLMDQSGELLCRSESQWLSLSDNLVLDYPKSNKTREAFHIAYLKTRRNNYTVFRKLTSTILPNKLSIIEFEREHCEFEVYADVEDKFQPRTSRQVLRKGSYDFCINSSFYGINNEAIGEVIIDGKRYGKRNASATGFFKVIDGRPYSGAPGALFSHIRGTVTYSCQAFPSVIGNGQVWSYIRNESASQHRNSWKTKTYRNLVGIRPNGNLVFIASGRGGLYSIREMALIAESLGLDHATMFDGGKVLQYRFRKKYSRLEFHAFNNKVELGRRLTQKSPVYVGVRILK